MPLPISSLGQLLKSEPDVGEEGDVCVKWVSFVHEKVSVCRTQLFSREKQVIFNSFRSFLVKAFQWME